MNSLKSHKILMLRRKMRKTRDKIAIIGTVGVPSQYGGFETLADNLVRYHFDNNRSELITVYCSTSAFKTHPKYYHNARLRYLNLKANGFQSPLYDIISIMHAVFHGHNQILLLGVSGALALPFLKILWWVNIVTNIDGIEWKREKWSGFAKLFLRISEVFAVRFSNEVIADNQAIADYVTNKYAKPCNVISYGGDHATKPIASITAPGDLPKKFALSLCRIEPENNVHMILDAFSKLETNLVFVGNWDNSEYGRQLKSKYLAHPNITVLNPVYDPSDLKAIRERASMYVHGHSAGGTNPALVEMMHFRIPVFAYDCSFNRYTTEDKAIYFSTAIDLSQKLSLLKNAESEAIGCNMLSIAKINYTWKKVGEEYFGLLNTNH